MNPVRLALVGYGAWGRRYVEAARATGIAEVVQVALRPNSKNRAAVEAAGLPVVWDIQDLRVDAAIIATHPKGTALIAPVMLEIVNLPVLIEKPAALSVEDAERLVESETASRLPVLVSHQHLFAEAYEKMRARGVPDIAVASFTGPVSRDYPALWDYGAHAVACLLGLGRLGRNFQAGVSEHRTAMVDAWYGSHQMTYDGYAPAEPSLTRAVRAFARAVQDGGTEDWRFGAHWALDVARALEGAISGEAFSTPRSVLL